MPFDNDNVARQSVGRLRYRGGVELRSRDARFGGLSALYVTPDGRSFTGITDKGHLITGTPRYDGDGPSVDTKDCLDFWHHWVVDHICNADMDYRGWVVGRPGLATLLTDEPETGLDGAPKQKKSKGGGGGVQVTWANLLGGKTRGGRRVYPFGEGVHRGRLRAEMIGQQAADRGLLGAGHGDHMAH